MPSTAEKLAEIDAELDAFGKSNEALTAVVLRAREVAASFSGDESLTGLLEGREEAVQAAREAAKANLPARPAPLRAAPAHSTAVGSPAPSPDDEDEPIGSGMVEIPEAELRKANLPPVLELGESSEGAPSEGAPSEGAFPENEVTSLSSPPPPEELDEAFTKNATSDIHGMSVEELFADAEPTHSESDPSELADFLDDVEEVRLSDPDLALESLEDDHAATDVPPRPRTVPPPVPAAAAAASRAPALKRELFEEEDATMVGSIGDLLSSSDDFELLVDDDVLELDSSETEVPPALTQRDSEADTDSGEEKKGGLISRILGRK